MDFGRKTFLITEVRVGHTFEGLVGNTVFFPPDEYELDEEELSKSSTMYSFRFIGGGYVHPRISLGLGLGIEGNSGYIKTTSPFFVDARLHF